MPLAEDRIRALEGRIEIPDGAVPGTRLTWLSTDDEGDAIVDWTSDPALQVREGVGDPNGALFAPIATLYVDKTSGAPKLWQNQDGQDTWTEVGGGGTADLLFAKQMYGADNDPGGSAPVDPWSEGYGGLYSLDITDPETEAGGRLTVELLGDLGVSGAHESRLVQSSGPDLDNGYVDRDAGHVPTGTPRAFFYDDAEVYTSTGSQSASYMNAVDCSDSGTATAFAEWVCDNGTDDSRIEIDNTAGQQPKIRMKSAISGNTSDITIELGRGDPNGVKSRTKGSLIIDCTTPNIWQNTNGSTAWTAH